ncbi:MULTISPECIES: GNAT family N-acetyltransferase [Pseudomonas]|uniref:N-acetyltransferase n=1 Tax=Pseudomonas plecoglossicida TaxID=70775 RepID=A0ABX4TWJ6_PSEDL|nr:MULTISPECIES: GNAT family N-acetyltransferase [Pseudomonas]PLU84865.1 N-acetyltransferase [Pseudomonas plecoglossicida]PLU91189.1 N-acetyltransferase [Pseudomonas plecoglossicida]PLU98108.1 N-acetyltransferase [Pseudomonas plecoglossicida]PLV11796.1 N-acetyltransferase [Pseudomonas plecoglossicida]QOE09199.1 GNAT family N-acetyltransferase [Pseudomonas asiatica]
MNTLSSKQLAPGEPQLQWLRQADSDTAPAIMQLINSTVGDGGVLGYEHEMSAGQSVEFTASLQERIRGGDTHVLLGKAMAGPACLVILSRSSMPNCRHIADLSKGVVHPAYRGSGLVARAFSEVVRLCQAQGIELLTLDVREGTRAHRLWQSFGFQTYGVLDDYARVDGVKHRGHYMAQTVESLALRLNLH